jgi:ATP-dependent Clp protease ATP-binding subunit ClpA
MHLFNTELEEEVSTVKSSPKKGKKSSLESDTINLCEKAKAGGIDPLLGREEEVLRTVQVLSRRRKNNPLFVGQAGVGKTAIAQGIAKHIVDGKVPDKHCVVIRAESQRLAQYRVLNLLE